MDKLREAARQALDALYAELEADTCEEFADAAEKCYEAITALREALAEQAEQEPVACIIHTKEGDYLDWNSKGYSFYIDETPLYTAPVRTKDLTDDEIVNAAGIGTASEGSIMRFRAVIAADREKNK